MLRVHHKNQKVKLEGSKIDLIIQQKSNARKARAFNNVGSSQDANLAVENIGSKLEYSPMTQTALRPSENTSSRIVGQRVNHKTDNGLGSGKSPNQEHRVMNNQYVPIAGEVTTANIGSASNDGFQSVSSIAGNMIIEAKHSARGPRVDS